MDFMKIAITVPYLYRGEAADIAAALTTGGFSRVHLRKPDATSAQVRALVEGIPAELRPRITMHYHFDVALEATLGGVHLNSRNPRPPQGWSGLVSRSAHSIGELGGDEDYLFISPVFPSISKPGHLPPFTLQELSSCISRRVVALGGVTPGQLPQLEAMGFGGAAMLGAAWCAEIDHAAFRLQFITHPTERHDVVAGAAEALRGGCRWVQLRHKDASPGELMAEGRELAHLCRQYGATFIVDDHVELASVLGADGVHLGKNDMPVAQARRILGPCRIIGATANTAADVLEANSAGADYVGIGPFRFTRTKQNLSPVLGTGGYEAIRRECTGAGIELPAVVIGGITGADIPEIMATGMDGVAVSSAILSAPSPAEATAEILRRL